jgi:acetyltransferase-like isoleucine patch superfamily enzyme
MKNITGLKRYSLSQIIYLFFSKIRTWIIAPKARLIRFPIDLRNKSQIDFGKGLTTGKGCRLEVEISEESTSKGIKMRFGNNIQINDYVHITASEKVIIEDNVLIASKVYISDSSHGAYGRNGLHSSPLEIPKDREIVTAPVTIKKNVWLGEHVSILMGVTIGEGCIVGANAVVTKSIPPYCIVVGNPAKVIKQYDFNLRQWLPTIKK